MPKGEILDPQGQAIVGALGGLGHAGISNVRQGKRFELEVDDSVDDSALAEIAESLLADTVIGDWTVSREPQGRRVSASSPSPGRSTTWALPGRCVRPAPAPSACGTPTPTSRVSTQWWCPADFPTATICGPVLSPGSPRLWVKSSPLSTAGCQFWEFATVFRCCVRPGYCPVRLPETPVCISSAAMCGYGWHRRRRRGRRGTTRTPTC